MRFVTFQDGGAEKIGVRQGDTIIDVSAAAAAFGGDMIGVIKGGDAGIDHGSGSACDCEAQVYRSILKRTFFRVRVKISLRIVYVKPDR